MSSAYSPLWKRLLHRFMPFLFSKCPMGNYHWIGDHTCWCVRGCNGWAVAVKDKGKWLIYKVVNERLAQPNQPQSPTPEAQPLTPEMVARNAAEEIVGLFSIAVPRGVRYSNGIKQTIAIIIEQNMKGITR